MVSVIERLITVPLEFVYWIKWIAVYVTIRLHNAFHKKRFDLYDGNVLGDPVKLGYIVPQLENDLESPFPESHLKESTDEVTFYGVNSKSECLLARISRGCNQMADAWIYLKLSNGKTYTLMETMGFQQSADGKCETFSCGKLQMHYLSPMRRWRILYCGMLKEMAENNKDVEESIFVKFNLIWAASSDVYDCTLDTNPEGFAEVMAKSSWELLAVPPIKKFKDALNFYAQTGVTSGTISVNDGPEHEIYLFGEKIRNLGKSRSIVGCKLNTILGNAHANGFTFHLSTVSAPYAFNNLPFGFVIESDGVMATLKNLDITTKKPCTAEKNENTITANFLAGEHYELKGKVLDTIVLNSSQGWSGRLELSFIEFEVKNQKGYGLILTGNNYEEPKRPSKLLPSIRFPEIVPFTVKFTNDISQLREVSGGKGSSLGKLTQLSKDNDFIVPKGIVVTTAAYNEFLTQNILDAVKYLENVAYGNESGDLKEACNTVSSIVEKTPLPLQIRRSITEDLMSIFRKEAKFAVRSSATGEDSAAMSAAGQMDTFLGVQGLDKVFLAVTKCWASQFGYIAVEYKRRNGQVLNSPMAVVIQEMVACDVSGVLFTLDPVTSNPSVITITANYGLGETVVSGAVEPDTVVLRRKDNEVLELDSVAVGNKHQKMVMLDSGGTSTVELDENSKTQSCLSKESALRLGELAIKIERYYKCSCDIEWGILDKKIYILQSRPVTTAAATTDYEIKHEFDSPLQCENQYLTVANVGEVMPGAVSTLGLELATKYFNSVIRRTMTTGMVDNLFANKYFLTGMFSFYNHLMMTAAELIIQNGLDTINSKAFMMSTFGRILDDPELFEYAKTKLKKGFKPTFKMALKYYWDLFTFDFGFKNIRNKIYNHPLNFLKQKTAEETFTAILKSCSDFDARLKVEEIDRTAVLYLQVIVVWL
ncbi:putative phosphoenolpyruvate synthase [Trichonephila clavipes]|nr:putative phosphoenolpyruvate synthase [Trichonephila clavipes]